MDLHASDRHSDRLKAAPLLFFMNHGGEDGALSEFLGFGLIKQAHRVTQLHKGRPSATTRSIACCCVGQRTHKERNCWTSLGLTLGVIPQSRLRMLRGSRRLLGGRGLRAACSGSNLDRFVDLLFEAKSGHRAIKCPPEDSHRGRVLKEILRSIRGQLQAWIPGAAALATQHEITVPGLAYMEGWITPVGPDGGVDFVQRLEPGEGVWINEAGRPRASQGRKPWPLAGNGVSAEELARVVARLRRGSIGAT